MIHVANLIRAFPLNWRSGKLRQTRAYSCVRTNVARFTGDFTAGGALLLLLLFSNKLKIVLTFKSYVLSVFITFRNINCIQL